MLSKRGAEGQSRTDTGLPRPVFETGASTIPPLRRGAYFIAKRGGLVALDDPTFIVSKTRNLAVEDSARIHREIPPAARLGNEA